jgi:hypothetical protein
VLPLAFADAASCAVKRVPRDGGVTYFPVPGNWKTISSMGFFGLTVVKRSDKGFFKLNLW